MLSVLPGRTSRAFQQACLPKLYHSVDISYHNSPGLWPSRYPPLLVGSDNVMRRTPDEDEILCRRQQQFIETLINRPEYGNHVRILTWTYKTWDNRDEHWPETRMWKVFQSMRHLEKFDFASLIYEGELVPAPSLFASATSIRLVGEMSHEMARSLLWSADPSRLTYLELDNVQDLAQESDGVDLIPGDLSEMPGTQDAIDGRTLVWRRGPMRSHLGHLTGRCTSLKHLVLRSVGQEVAPDYVWNANIDEARYTEWASFIDSVKPTLQTLDIEQGVAPRDTQDPGCATIRIQRRSIASDTRPMDLRFESKLLPVLLEGPWPRLRTMTLRGMCASEASIESAMGGQLLGLETRLRSHGVSITIEKEASKSFYFPYFP